MSDNPHAFPSGDKHSAATFEPGMSLRDWFAGQALHEFASFVTIADPATFNTVARYAYLMADAMLAERQRVLSGGQGK